MQTWQKWLLIALAAFFLFHLIRDLLQHYKIKTFIATIWTKSDLSKTPSWFWTVFNSYIYCSLGLLTSIIALKINQFFPFGLISALCLIIFFLAWLVYWFLF